MDLEQNILLQPSTVTNDVRLLGKIVEMNTILVFNLPNNPGTEWITYSITLAADSGWYKEVFENEVPTELEMREVLSILEHMYIRGEYSRAVDTGSIDSVYLRSGN